MWSDDYHVAEATTIQLPRIFTGDALVIGGTVRASNSRFEEPLSPLMTLFTGGGFQLKYFSLISLSLLMNSTTNNQGDNCIIAKTVLTDKLEEFGNQVLIGEGDCEELQDEIDAATLLYGTVVLLALSQGQALP